MDKNLGAKSSPNELSRFKDKNLLVMPIPFGPKYYTWFTRATLVANKAIKIDVCIFIPETHFRTICRNEFAENMGVRPTPGKKENLRILSFPDNMNECLWKFCEMPLVSKKRNYNDFIELRSVSGSRPGDPTSHENSPDPGIQLHRGTILFGTLCPGTINQPIFVAENVHFCAGQALSQRATFEDNLSSKLYSLLKIMEAIKITAPGYCVYPIEFMVPSIFSLPTDLSLMQSKENSYSGYYYSEMSQLKKTLGCTSETQNPEGSVLRNSAPILVGLNGDGGQRFPDTDTDRRSSTERSSIDPSTAKLFFVSANRESDIYSLYTSAGPGTSLTFHSLALIPTYNSSVYMNSIFRTIKENANLDLAEESDDEETFFNLELDKFVDIHKKKVMPFIYVPKFNKYAPYIETEQANRAK
jgi:hypothetical protein